MKDDIQKYIYDEKTLSCYAKEVAEYPRITPEREIELSKIIINKKQPKNKRDKARNELVLANLKLVLMCARNYHKDHFYLNLCDLIQYGNVGLIQAAMHFDWRKGFRFSTYAVTCIKRNIDETVFAEDNEIRFPDNYNEYIKKINALEGDYGPNLPFHFLSEKIGVSINVVKQALKIRQYKMLYLNATISGEDNSVDFNNVIEDTSSPDPLMLLEDKQTKDRVIDIIEKMPRQDQVVAFKRLFGDIKDQHSLQYIADEFDLTKESVRLKEIKAFNTIKKELKIENNNEDLRNMGKYRSLNPWTEKNRSRRIKRDIKKGLLPLPYLSFPELSDISDKIRAKITKNIPMRLSEMIKSLKKISSTELGYRLTKVVQNDSRIDVFLPKEFYHALKAKKWIAVFNKEDDDFLLFNVFRGNKWLAKNMYCKPKHITCRLRKLNISSNYKGYTPKEIEFLIKYKDAEWSFLTSSLHRTVDSMKNKLVRLNITRKYVRKYETPKEIEIIKNNPNRTCSDFVKMFGWKRSKVKYHVRKNNIKLAVVCVQKKYNSEEDSFIKENYLKQTCKWVANKLNRTVASISKRMAILNCKKVINHQYTTKELEFIRNNTDKGYVNMAKILNIKPKTLHRKLRRMKIPCRP